MTRLQLVNFLAEKRSGACRVCGSQIELTLPDVTTRLSLRACVRQSLVGSGPAVLAFSVFFHL